jgi:hypothetical protein
MKQIQVLIVLVIIACCSCKRQSHRSDSIKWGGNKLVFYTYGAPEAPIRKNATNVVAAKWGFGYKSVAGCLVNKALTDSVQRHNNMVEQALVEKYGKAWNIRFDKEVNAELAAQQKVTALLNKQQLNLHKRAILNKEGKGLNYYIKPVNDNQLYQVSAEGWLDTKGKPTYVSYFRFRVDLKNSTVKLLSDSVYKI